MQETRSTEGETRRQVMLYVLKNGPVTAADIAHELGLSAAGVRRHLDILVDTGYAETVKPRAGAAGSGRAHRGRPAKHFRLTETGRTQFGHSYDELASDALHAIRQAGGSAAVERFATAHWNRLLAGVDLDAEVQAGDEESLSDAVRKLADVLDAHGFAATVTNAGRGVQICQHHCPWPVWLQSTRSCVQLSRRSFPQSWARTCSHWPRSRTDTASALRISR